MEGLRKLSYEELNKLEKEAEKGWRNIHKVKVITCKFHLVLCMNASVLKLSINAN
jgi:hypothetical protein